MSVSTPVVLVRRPDGVVLRTVPGTDPVMRQVADLSYETLHRPFGVSRSDSWDDRDPLSTHFVAMDGELLAGYARLIVDGQGGQIRQVAVDSRYRRRGIATALVQAAVTRARGLGLRYAFLNAREHAVSLYERVGFVVVGAPFRMGRTFLVHVRMELPLR